MSVSLVEDNTLRATNNGYEVQIRMNWYRSLPLSCIEKVALSLDGQPVDPGSVLFDINDHEYRLADLVNRTDEFWYVLDSATVRVEQPGAVTAGESHTIEVETALRAPYIAIGANKFLVITSQYKTTQVAS